MGGNTGDSDGSFQTFRTEIQQRLLSAARPGCGKTKAQGRWRRERATTVGRGRPRGCRWVITSGLQGRPPRGGRAVSRAVSRAVARAVVTRVARAGRRPGVQPPGVQLLPDGRRRPRGAVRVGVLVAVRRAAITAVRTAAPRPPRRRRRMREVAPEHECTAALPIEFRRVRRRRAAHGASSWRVGEQRGGGGGQGGHVAGRCEQSTHAMLDHLDDACMCMCMCICMCMCRCMCMGTCMCMCMCMCMCHVPCACTCIWSVRTGGAAVRT